MCGIIGYISKLDKPDTGKRIIEQYQDQFDRGVKGFGVMSLTQQRFKIERATEPIKALLDTKFLTSKIAIFHHRQPTSTDNKLAQTHPIKVSHDELDSDYYVIHNGIISNSDDLFEKHTDKLGYIYTTFEPSTYSKTMGYHYSYGDKFNDSEAFAIELARFIDGEIGQMETKGSMAFLAIKVNKTTQKPTHMYWGRNDRNPLELLNTKTGLLIASTIRHEDAQDVDENTYHTVDLSKLYKKKKIGKLSSLIKVNDLIFKPEPLIIEPPKEKTHTKNWVREDKRPYEFGKRSYAPPASNTIKKRYSKMSDAELAKEAEQAEAAEAYADKLINNKATEKEDFEIRTYGFSPRMKAYIKMSDRIKKDFWPEVENLLQDMSFDEVSDDEITSLVSNLQDILLEKECLSEKRIRPFYDHKEDIELDAITSETREDELKVEEEIAKEKANV